MPEVVTDDGIRLHYVRRGHGALPILYVHWLGGDAATWADLWAELGSDDYCHVAVDMRGHGRSEASPCSFSNERLARDVLHVADDLGFDRFIFAGHSFGGKVGLKLAAMAPARLRGLILIGAVGPGVVPLDRTAVDAILERSADLAFVRETFRPWFSVWPRAAIDRALVRFSTTPAWALRAVCENALWTDLAGEIGPLATPALVIAGDADPVYGPAYQEASVIPFLIRPGRAALSCGHGLVLERPEEIALHCATFLQAPLHATRRSRGQAGGAGRRHARDTPPSTRGRPTARRRFSAPRDALQGSARAPETFRS